MAAIVTAVVERQAQAKRHSALTAGGGSRGKLVMSDNEDDDDDDDNDALGPRRFDDDEATSEFESAVEHSAELEERSERNVGVGRVYRSLSQRSRRSTAHVSDVGDDSDAFVRGAESDVSADDAEVAVQDEARRAFASYDDGSQGTLSKTSFRRALRELGRALTQRESDAMFRAIDTDGSGAIDEAEVC